MCKRYNTTEMIYRLSALFLLIFIPLSVLSCIKGPEEKTYLIGIINLNPQLISLVEGFKEGMTEHGYVEGKNVTYIHMKEERDIDATLLNLKGKKPDLILAVSTPAVKQAHDSVKKTGIPIIGIAFDPVGGGIVKNLTHKEENITGIVTGEGIQKSLEWLLLIKPDTDQIFVPVKFDTPAAQLSMDKLKEAAAKFNVNLSVSNVNDEDDLQTTLSSIPESIDAIFILHSLFIVSNLDTIVESAVKRKLPTVSGSGLYKKGVTISYGHEHRTSGLRASEFAYKVLHGYPAKSLPFESPSFSLGLNLDNAEKIGLTIPDYILKQASLIRPSTPAAEYQGNQLNK